MISTTHSYIPEPLRVAHLIATGVVCMGRGIEEDTGHTRGHGMMIKVKAFARFRETFGKEHSLEPDGKATAMAPLIRLCTPHGSHDMIFDESGMSRKYANILVNRRHIRTELANGGRGCDIPSGGGWLK